MASRRAASRRAASASGDCAAAGAPDAISASTATTEIFIVAWEREGFSPVLAFVMLKHSSVKGSSKAPVTFFIFVMSVINGLQGGFEMARVMTQGGPAGATTTLSYFIYTEGFETGRLGYASAVAWALFALVFAVTLVNLKFGKDRIDV